MMLPSTSLHFITAALTTGPVNDESCPDPAKLHKVHVDIMQIVALQEIRALIPGMLHSQGVGDPLPGEVAPAIRLTLFGGSQIDIWDHDRKNVEELGKHRMNLLKAMMNPNGAGLVLPQMVPQGGMR